MINKKRGFTLIELLVVIAIIGILSSVVLASLNTARNKGKDASAKASLESVRASAEVYYNGTGANTYGSVANTAVTLYSSSAISSGGVANVCSDADIAKLMEATVAQGATSASCVVDTARDAYVAFATLNTGGGLFCVDSTGFAGVPTASSSTPAHGTAGSATSCN